MASNLSRKSSPLCYSTNVIYLEWICIQFRSFSTTRFFLFHSFCSFYLSFAVLPGSHDRMIHWTIDEAKPELDRYRGMIVVPWSSWNLRGKSASLPILEATFEKPIRRLFLFYSQSSVIWLDSLEIVSFCHFGRKLDRRMYVVQFACVHRED